LGKCQVLHRSRKKLRTGRKSRQHTRAIQPFISGQPKAFSGQEATGSPPGGSLAALGKAAARHNNEITKGGVYDE
jgi:hypothetical protein